jgi:hypothetical protein
MMDAMMDAMMNAVSESDALKLVYGHLKNRISMKPLNSILNHSLNMLAPLNVCIIK